MLKSIRNKTLDVIISTSISIILGLGFTAIRPQAVHTEESQQQKKLLQQAKLSHNPNYMKKIQDSLISQKEFGSPTSALQTLDNLCNEIRKKVKIESNYDKKEAITALKKINTILKEEGSFAYKINDILIKGLEKQENGQRFIDCDDYSSLYLIVAERIGLNLKPVYAPRHMFLECEFDEGRFYWEPTTAEEKDLKFYQEHFNLPENSVYPKILNEQEFDAIQLCHIGVAWHEKEEYEKAIAYYESSLKLNPSYAPTYNNMGVAYAKQENLDKALKCYEEAIKLNPDYADPVNNKGVTLYKLGHPKEAIKHFKKAIEINPEFCRALVNMGLILREERKNKEAFEYFMKVTELKQKVLSQAKY